MDPVKQKLKEVGSKRAEQLKRLVAEHGNDVIQEVTLEQVISGMKGIVALLTDTSSLILRKAYASEIIPFLN